MNPFFFGDSQQQLFGVYHPARGRSSRGVVICYPWAREYLLAHPTLKLLSQRLADAGWHALRFDYFGTGDSAGDSDGSGHKQWLEDVSMAIDELKAIAGVKEVTLVGMRHGATLAAMTAAQRDDIARVVLWDPVADGRAYLSELGVGNHAPAMRDVDAQGAVLTHRLRADLEAITPAVFGADLPRTLVVTTDTGSDTMDVMVTHLRSLGVECELEHVPDVQVWREEWGRGGKGLAVTATNSILRWLS